MNDRFRVSTTLPCKLEELGVPPALVLQQAGLPAGLFEPEKIVVSTEEFFALYCGIAEAAGDAPIGLKLASEDRVERYDPIALAAVSARSLRDALQRLIDDHGARGPVPGAPAEAGRRLRRGEAGMRVRKKGRRAPGQS